MRKIFHVKDILVGSKYIINITLKNVGAQVFNGGQLVVSTSWTSSQITVSSYPIKTLTPTESQAVTYCHDALRKDYGLIFAKLSDKNNNVQVYNIERVPYTPNQCFNTVKAVDMEELQGRYAFIISAISLFLLMIKDVIIPLIIWYAIFTNNSWLLGGLKWLKLIPQAN